MTGQFKSFLFIATIYLLTGCNSSINLSDHINKSVPINLTVNSIDSTGFTKSTRTTIAINSEKYLKLIEWLDNNKNG